VKNEAPKGIYWDQWVRWMCPNEDCGKLNWVCEGNIRDLSGNDTEAAICWNCKIKFWVAEEMRDDPDLYLNGDQEIDGQGEDWIEEVYDREGRERP
jgi:hypothetical protein